MLKGINKCIEKENVYKHRGFYSECHDADESTECTWRAKLRAAKDKRESPQSYQVGPESYIGYIQTSGLSISTAAIRFLILLVLRRLSFPATMRQIQPQLPPFFPFSVVSQGPLGFPANNTAGLRPLFKRLIGCCLGREAISEVSVTAEKVRKQGKEERPLSQLPTGCHSSIEIAVAFKPSCQSQRHASMG